MLHPTKFEQIPPQNSTLFAEIRVIRSYARVATRRLLILIAALSIAAFVPLTLAYLGFGIIIRASEVLGPFVPFAVIAIFVYAMRSSRDKPSKVSLEKGGIRPAWDSRRLYTPRGKPCFYPWILPQLGIPQGVPGLFSGKQQIQTDM